MAVYYPIFGGTDVVGAAGESSEANHDTYLRDASLQLERFLGRLTAGLASNGCCIVIVSAGLEDRTALAKVQGKGEPLFTATARKTFGILCMSGAGVPRDERLYGATAVDIVPTILAALGVSVSRDLPGKVLLGAVGGTPAHSKSRDSSEAGTNVISTLVPSATAQRAKGPSNVFEEWRCEQCLSLALLYLHTQRPHMALAAVTMAREMRLDDLRCIAIEAQCRLLIGMYREAAVGLTELDAHQTSHYSDGERALLLVLKAHAHFGLGELDKCLSELHSAERYKEAPLEVRLLIGDMYFSLGLTSAAIWAYRWAAAADQRNELPYQALAQAHLGECGFHSVVRAALASIRLRYDLPYSHLRLGIALAFIGNHERAIRAFETAVQFEPNLGTAHGWLHRLYRRADPGLDKAAFHLRRFVELGL